MSVERMTARVTGRVQGVGFRWWIRQRAEALHLTGWVMNANDERAVDVVAEGSTESLDDLERLINQGPQGARVEHVATRRGPATGEYERFGIVRS